MPAAFTNRRAARFKAGAAASVARYECGGSRVEVTTKKRTKITVETDRLLVITRRQGGTEWCAACNQRVEMLSVDGAASLTQLSPRTIYRWVEAQRIHFTENPEGVVRICANSLNRRILKS